MERIEIENIREQIIDQKVVSTCNAKCRESRESYVTTNSVV
jgi:hypothetical protein